MTVLDGVVLVGVFIDTSWSQNTRGRRHKQSEGGSTDVLQERTRVVRFNSGLLCCADATTVVPDAFVSINARSLQFLSNSKTLQ